MEIKKIIIIGNAAGGKTRLARRLAGHHRLPLTHVDSLQFLPGLKMRPYSETVVLLDAVIDGKEWLIDGFGPLDSLERRLVACDRIVFVDLPLGRHIWWLLKRQLQVPWNPRQELPPDCNEFRWSHTLKILDNLRKVHRGMRPELLRIFRRPELQAKLVHIRALRHWSEVFKDGL